MKGSKNAGKKQGYCLQTLMAGMFLLFFGFLLLSYQEDAGNTVWPVGLLLVVTGIFFANRIVWIYAMVGTALFLILTMFSAPVAMVEVVVGDHIARFGILLAMGIISYIIHLQFQRRMRDNLNQMESISHKNEENRVLLENIQETTEQLSGLSAIIGMVINQSSRSLSDIATTMEQINRNAVNTSGSIDQVNTNLESFNNNVQAILERVMETDTLTATTRDLIHTNRQDAVGLGESMKEIHGSVQDVAQAVEQVENNMGMIQRIVPYPFSPHREKGTGPLVAGLRG